MTTINLRFQPFDTWFFRESRPQGSVGASDLGSLFPPPMRSLAGAVRTAIGDDWHRQNGTQWRDLHKLEALQQVIGLGDDLGALSFEGPFLSRNGERLYPAPLVLAEKKIEIKNDENNNKKNKKNTFLVFLMAPGDAVECDLGRVRLPSFPSSVPGLSDTRGAKRLDDAWITRAGLIKVLEGQAPEPGSVFKRDSLLHEESRLGIARSNAAGSVIEGLLYQTRHLRLNNEENISIDISVNDGSKWQPQAGQTVRLGAEGRLSSLESVAAAATLPAPSASKKTKGIVLYLLTPALFRDASGQPCAIPTGFRAVLHDGITVWEGECHGIALRIHAMALGKAHREGGWDMAQHRSRPVQSYVGAGASYFAEVLTGEINAAIKALHLRQLGDEQGYGRGQMACGLWTI